jgi:hypothetical protein
LFVFLSPFCLACRYDKSSCSTVKQHFFILFFDVSV